MKSIVAWAIRNTPAMNTILVGILAVGIASLFGLRREVFPEFDLEYIIVTVPYPGAAPSEVEEGICQKVEEAVRSIDGIKQIESTAAEGSGMVLIELVADIPDVQRTLNEVRSEVDRIPSFPELAEDPIVEQITLRDAAIRVGVLGPDDDSPEAELKLRDLAEKVREELLLLPAVSQVKLLGVRDYQIDIEISEDTLRKYGLTLQDVAALVRRQNIELPGGTMRTESQEVLLRGKSKQLIGTEIAKIPLITQPNGVVLTVGDLGTVRDQFTDDTAINRINGRPGMVILVEKVGSEDLLQITEEVKEFVSKVNKPGGYQTPAGYELATWADVSVIVRDRLELLGRNGLQGLVLVFVILAIFLELRLAFWVALGIPVAILGSCALLLGTGNTLNMISMFAFLTALGILVDDAIVVGENVYAHRQAGKSGVQAAIDGTCEVMPSVMASVTTTIIAFTPLMFVPGILGKFLAVMPFAVIVMLIISLFESTLILPCHLAHEHGFGWVRRVYRYSQRGIFLTLWTSLGLAIWVAVFTSLSTLSASTGKTVGVSALILLLVLLPHLAFMFKRVGDLFAWANSHVSSLLHSFISRLYLPFLDWSLSHRAIVMASAATTLMLAAALLASGIVPYNAFPKLDGDTIIATVVYPDGTPASVAEKATVRCEEAIRKINEKYSEPGKPLVKLVHRSIGQSNVGGNEGPGMAAAGSNIGSVGVELVPAAERDVDSNDLVNEWREAAGEFPGAESVSFKTPSMGPPGEAIELKLMSTPEHMAEMEEAAEKCKDELAKFAGVYDITDDSRPGKWEFQVKVKDEAKALGNTVADLAETVRASYYGQEVMRLQRGRHEVKLMVRYPLEDRHSLANFDDIRVRTAIPATRRGGDFASLRKGIAALPERPLSELADIDVQRGFSTIHRYNQMRSLTITADINEKVASGKDITEKMKTVIVPKILAEYKDENTKEPTVKVHWGGKEEDTNESVVGLMAGLMIALVAMFGLLTYQFKSYLQPILIMLIIPFGAIGAILGHLFLGLDLTLFSLFGLVALTGVVVNDSIVLIDFINHRLAAGMPINDALLDAGRRRFRPVMLTSLTTIGGLLPILLEKSMQAQVLIPMATSLCFGLMFATVMVLLLVPSMYSVYYQLTTSKSERTVWPPGPDGGFDDISEKDLTTGIEDLEKDNGIGTIPKPDPEPLESSDEGPTLTVRQTGTDSLDDPLPEKRTGVTG